MIRKVILLLPFLFLAACASLQKPPLLREGHPPRPKKEKIIASSVKNILYSQYHEWKGVKYKKGGLSKKGIDCSGFVYLTYLSKFGVKLPRTAEKMAALGEKVSQEGLRPGDLVFFKTGFFSKHVGIFIGGRKFLHSSSSKGVTISSLDDYYWSKKYWKSKRISE